MILVTGANGVVGKPLCDSLQEQGLAFLTVSRKNASDEQRVNAKAFSVHWDLEQRANDTALQQIEQVDTLIHCAPIWLLPAQLNVFEHTKLSRLVVFSSTSVISKQGSADSSEKRLVEQLSSAERALEEYCSQHELNLTILRPSMIYGYARDQNVTHIARFIKKWRIMFLVGRADGLRQPVHADDLVDVSIAILQSTVTYGQTYTLAGQEVLTYQEMVERIFIGLGKRPRVIRLPLFLYRLALNIASRLTRFAYTPAMADRMNQDLSYDISPAQTDFDYRPQAFLAKPKRDLTGLL